MSVESGLRAARRIENLPPYLFAEVDRRIAEKRAAGFDVISLGSGPGVVARRPRVELTGRAPRD